MYILYSNPWSQHARRVIALLEVAGLPYSIRHVALEDGQHRSDAFLAINPNHQVPTLLDGRFALHESNAILRYLCVRHGLDEWYPEQANSRGLIEQWLDWNQCRLAPAVLDIVLNSVFLGDAGDHAAIARGKALLDELVPILDAGLWGRQYLVGTTPTIADLSVASNLTQLGLADAFPESPNITPWYQRICSLPGFAMTLAPLRTSLAA